MYLHYQGKGDGTHLPSANNFIRIKSEKDETFIDKVCYGVSGYVKLEPNVKYYIELTLYAKSYSYSPEFMVSIDNFRNNILMKEGEEIQRYILSPQSISFFKNISNLLFNETLIFDFDVSKSSYHYDYFYIKFYESDNFEQLEEKFPSKEEGFDSCIRQLSNGGKFTYELHRKYNSQKGVLFGVFFKIDTIGMGTTSISVSAYNKTEESKETDKENNDSGDIATYSVIGVVGGLILLTIIFYICSRNKYSSSTDTHTYALVRLD